jgi:hypothetical protein
MLLNANIARGVFRGVLKGTAELSVARHCLVGAALSRDNLALFAGGVTGVSKDSA